MTNFWQTILASALAVIASSGFWAYMQRRDITRQSTDMLLRGLAYEKIIDLGFKYIERGWITQDEYEDYRRYLYDPYKELRGNGVTERVMAEVSNLPIRSRAKYAELLKAAKSRGEDDEYGQSRFGAAA